MSTQDSNEYREKLLDLIKKEVSFAGKRTFDDLLIYRSNMSWKRQLLGSLFMKRVLLSRPSVVSIPDRCVYRLDMNLISRRY